MALTLQRSFGIMAMALCALAAGHCAETNRIVCTALSPRPEACMKGSNERFAAETYVRDFAEMGGTDIYFFEHEGEGGPFYHKTTVPHTASSGYIVGRDYLEELLKASARRNVKVWLTWSTPIKGSSRRNQPGYKDAIYGLDDITLASPQLKKVYADVMAEIARQYLPRYSNTLAGVFWHEIHSSYGAMNTPADVARFKAFCRDRFKEDYKAEVMPEVNGDDPWWRRRFLFQIHIMTSFVREMAAAARANGLQTAYCHYPMETSSGWTIGADILELEQLCDHMWEVSFALENCKHYYSIKGAWLDFGPTYRNSNLPQYYASAFHGYPLSYFDFATPLYVNEIRSHFPATSGWVKAHGDFYTGHSGRTEKEIALFYGKEKLGAWLKLMASWQPGETPAQVCVAINPTPFLMLNPTRFGQLYAENVKAPMVALSYRLDVDGMVTGSRAMGDNLKRYELIILPGDMAQGMAEEAYGMYLDYARGGGKLLVINTPVTTGAGDLTNVKDRTRELCGLDWKGYAKPDSTLMEPVTASPVPALPSQKLVLKTGQVEPGKAEVVVKNKATGAALLTRYALGKGEVWFSAASFQPGLDDYFRSLAAGLVAPRFGLEPTQGLRILEAVKMDNRLGITLWGMGRATLKVDAVRAGLSGAEFQVKDIITGRIFGSGLKPADLATRGVEVAIAYTNQPFVLAVGPQAALAEYPGIYPSDEVFKDMSVRRMAAENPQIPILVPEGTGPKVGLYHRGHGAAELINRLRKDNVRAFTLPRLDTEAMGYPDVIIIPQCLSMFEYVNQAAPVLRKFVENGGGILLIHDAAGFRDHTAMFNEVGKVSERVKANRLTVSREHPVTEGLAVGFEFTPGFQFDYLVIEPGPAGTAVISDTKGRAVVVAGPLGKGNVLLWGMMTGVAGETNNAGGEVRAPDGTELQLLQNAIRWLGTKPAKR